MTLAHGWGTFSSVPVSLTTMQSQERNVWASTESKASMTSFVCFGPTGMITVTTAGSYVGTRGSRLPQSIGAPNGMRSAWRDQGTHAVQSGSFSTWLIDLRP